MALLTLSGCDAFYFFVVENDTDQTVTVSVLGKDVRMRPCSVSNFVTGGVPYGRPVEIRVTDGGGKIIYTTTIKAGPGGKGNPFDIQIPAGEPRTCPTPASTFMLTVWNRGNEEVQLWLEGVQVGTVRAGSHERLGPFLGTWRDAGKITVRTDDGEESAIKLFSLAIDYDLGRVPEIEYAVASGW